MQLKIIYIFPFSRSSNSLLLEIYSTPVLYRLHEEIESSIAHSSDLYTMELLRF